MEEARTRGTPVTASSFTNWKAKFEKELALKKALEDDEKLRNLSGKEREEFKKVALRLTGLMRFFTAGTRDTDGSYRKTVIRKRQESGHVG